MQVKLLNVLEGKEVTQAGSKLPKAMDARIISATNTDLNNLVIENTFREDLLNRLNTIRIDLPPLRERLEDLPLLVDFFLQRLGIKYKKPTGINQGALRKLEKHHWPGNIRELKFTLEKAVILADRDILTERDFLFKTRLIPPEGPAMVDLKHNEKEIIKRAIQMSGGNLSQASRHLGITRRTLYNKISKYEI
jgi:DNA-binding NtrC family response regulator